MKFNSFGINAAPPFHTFLIGYPRDMGTPGIHSAYIYGEGGPGWIVKLNQTGTNTTGVINELLVPSSDINAGDITGITERYNTINMYEYYATLSCASGIIVLKLDAGGLPAGGTADEFVFNGNGTLPNARATSISFFNTGTVDEGLHVFGSDDVNNPDNHYLMKAYFSGESGCNGTNLTTSSALTTNANTFPVNTNSGLNVCTGISINNTLVSNITALCGPGSVPGGSNAKIVSNIFENLKSDINIYPNPSAGAFTFETGVFHLNSVELFDSFGRLLFTKKITEQRESNIFSFDALKLKPGVYTVVFISANQEKITKKIIFQP